MVDVSMYREGISPEILNTLITEEGCSGLPQQLKN